MNVNFCEKRPDEVFRAYIGADGEFVLQIRQKNSGEFQIRTGEETEWKAI